MERRVGGDGGNSRGEGHSGSVVEMVHFINQTTFYSHCLLNQSSK